MAQLNRPIKNVVVLGATGNIGRPIIDSLLAHSNGFKVTAVTRNLSGAEFPVGVTVLASDLSNDSLRNIFQAQDAVISCVPMPHLAEQRRFVDIAVASGVARFIPSEFGMDTRNPNAVQWRPGLVEKVKVVDYLKALEGKITWSGVITGGFLDWGLKVPGAFGLDIAKGTATIHDGGNVEFETTNVTRIGEAVAAALSVKYQEVTANQVLYINSFTVTQNQILAAVNDVLGRKLEVTRDTTRAQYDRAEQKLKENPQDASAGLDAIMASILGLGGFNAYSKEHQLWNEKLGLREENLADTVREVLKEH